MKSLQGIGLADVQAVYSGPEAELWELLMGEQIHLGGLESSRELAASAGIQAGMVGVDLCCCTGAGMRFLLRWCGVARMIGVDATPAVIAKGHTRNQAAGVSDRIGFVEADASATPLSDAAFDFVWGEDAWCYVVDKRALLAEAVRLLRPGGVVAFTDWVEGPAGLTDGEADRWLRFMKFPSVLDLPGYAALLEASGCEVLVARDTGRFARCVELYCDMIRVQLAYDALRILGFDTAQFDALANEMQFMHQLARQGKIAQGMFVARKKG